MNIRIAERGKPAAEGEGGSTFRSFENPKTNKNAERVSSTSRTSNLTI